MFIGLGHWSCRNSTCHHVQVVCGGVHFPRHPWNNGYMCIFQDLFSVSSCSPYPILSTSTSMVGGCLASCSTGNITCRICNFRIRRQGLLTSPLATVMHHSFHTDLDMTCVAPESQFLIQSLCYLARVSISKIPCWMI